MEGSFVERYLEDAATVEAGRETSTLSGACETWVAEGVPRSNYDMTLSMVVSQ